MNKKKIMLVLLEILLVVSIVVITPYNLNNLFGNNVVSAVNPQEIMNTVQSFLEDEENKLNTCVKSVDGSLCQQMLARDCEQMCESGCIEGKREDVPKCKLGTCIDKEEGICTPRTPITACEEDGATFNDKELENIPECQKKCCLIGGETRFVTKKQCDVLAERYQTETVFNEDIISEPECIFLSVGEVEGACVIQREIGSEEPDCKRTTLSECESMSGDFHERMLCSNSELNSTCKKQDSVNCIQGLDEVYWMDSCGNRENIFSSDKRDSWNDGLIMDKNESCKIGTSSNWLAYQKSCGNCNRFTGSKCGNITTEKELTGNPDGDVVCKDLACDVNGTRRENGETWCVYQNAIGTSLDVPLIGALGYFTSFHVDGLHSMSAPGGRHFRQSCFEGEIITEECANYRNDVCNENRLNKTDEGKYFSVATCRPNTWTECLNYNTDSGSPLRDMLKQLQPIIDLVPQAGKILQGPAQSQKFKTMNMMFRCESNPDCYVNSVSVGKDYKFPLCLPKYPPGFYSHDAEGEDQNICGFGNQQCTSVWVYESVPLTFGMAAEWKCNAGCECVEGSPPSSAKGSWDSVYPSKKLAQQSEDICVSLGDCGKKANYIGEGGFLFDSGYKFKVHAYDGMPKEEPDGKPKEVSKPKLQGVDDSKPIPGKYIDADYEGLFGEVFDGEENAGGGGSGEGEEGGGIGPKPPSFKPADTTMASIALTAVPGAAALGSTIAIATSTPLMYTSSYSVVAGVFPVSTASLVAFQAGAMGAAIGAAVVSLLVGISGIGAGVGVGGTIAYGVGGVVGGGMIAAGFAKGGSLLMGHLGIVVLVIVIIDIIAQWIAGVGDIKTVVAIFECGLWQPPKGSEESCDKCGEDGLPCSKYSCETLGKDCEFVQMSEGIQGQNGTNLCIYNPKKDVNGPIIVNVTKDAITTGFEYYDEDLGKASSSFKIKKIGTNNDCVNQLESFGFGFEISEHGECRYSYEPDKEFEEMTQFGNNLLSKQHSDSFSMTEVPFEGEEKKEITMYIKCKDYSSGEEGGNVGADNSVKFCIDPVDLTPPVVVSDTSREIMLPTDTETYTIRVEFNEEVSEARLGFTNAEYDKLEHKMTCSGRVCSVEVPINAGTNNFYVKAKDLAGNVNEQGTIINIVKSERGLVVSSVTPNNKTIETGGAVSSVDIEITTDGGIDGSAACSFSINNGRLEFFSETGGTTHRQKLNRLTAGTYNFEFLCVDKAGNEATEKTRLIIKLDRIYPEITRVYDESGTLVVITKEDATCGYTNTNCDFDVDEGGLMDGSGARHTTSLNYELEYFVKCKDEYGNEPTDCSMVVKGSEF